MYNILTDSGIPMKAARLTKMCPSETYSRVWEDKHLSDMLPMKNDLKQGDALSSLFFYFAILCAIRRVQVNQGGLKAQRQSTGIALLFL